MFISVFLFFCNLVTLLFCIPFSFKVGSTRLLLQMCITQQNNTHTSPVVLIFSDFENAMNTFLCPLCFIYFNYCLMYLPFIYFNMQLLVGNVLSYVTQENVKDISQNIIVIIYMQ